MRELCIAGRGSLLAMAQNELVKGLLEKEGYKVNILTVSTHGDRDRKSSVTELGGNGPFVRDVEKALLSGEADIAVHCVKDLPYEMAPGLCIAGMPAAADPRDCLILRERESAEGAQARGPIVIGTGSPRLPPKGTIRKRMAVFCVTKNYVSKPRWMPQKKKDSKRLSWRCIIPRFIRRKRIPFSNRSLTNTE